MATNLLACQDIVCSLGKDLVLASSSIVHILKDNKDAASAIESIAKILALVVGGWWTWQTYVRKRVQFPSAKVEHVIHHWEDGELKFLRVTVRMTNTGNVLIPIAEGCTWVQQLTPLPPEVQNAICSGKDPMPPDATEFDWDMIKERTLKAGQFEIEPGEVEEFHFDFTIEQSVSRVLIYSHMENPTKSGWWGTKKIGWNLSTVYEIPKLRKGFREWLTNL